MGRQPIRLRHLQALVPALLVAAALASGAAVTGLVTGAAQASGPSAHQTSWLTAGFNERRTNYDDLETTVGPANAHRLHRLWSTKLGAPMIAQPVEAAGVDVQGSPANLIYEGTDRGEFYAIRADDGQVVWQKDLGSMKTTCQDLPDEIFGIGGSAAIDFTSPGEGVVYVAGGDGAVYAFDLATGAEVPGWPVQHVFNPVNETVYGGLNLFKGRLYEITASHCDDPPYHGNVTEIGVAKHAILHRFYPAGAPSGGVSGGGIWGPAGVSVDPSNQDVFAATGNALGKPDNYRYSDSVVELDRSLRVRSARKPKLGDVSDVDFGSTPVLFRPAGCQVTLAAAENKTGALFVYSVGSRLGARHSQRLQMGTYPRAAFDGDPAWDPVTNMLYVANTSNSSSGPFKHGLVALRANHDCSLSLAWQRTLGATKSKGLPPPTVANGVVYFGDGAGNTEYAFDAASGRKLWQSSGISGQVYAPSAIVNGVLLVASWDHKLYAFGLGKR